MNPGNFFKSDHFESRQFVRRDLQRSYASLLGATHPHVDIGYHINPTGPTTTFGIQNESRYFELRDFSIVAPPLLA
jgi:hypothetical protein